MRPQISQMEDPCLQERNNEIRHFLARASGRIL
jgi:hypothetical protein